MPFGEASSASYGTHGSSGSSRKQSLSEQQQSPPLRNRPPRGSTSSPSEILFSHPHSSFDEFPYPPYSELPFTSLKRRKTPGSQFVKWAMRAVLASPVIVLVFWSIGAMIFSKNVSHKAVRNNNSSNKMSARLMRRMADAGIAQGPPMMQAPVMMMQQQQPLYGWGQTNNMGYQMPQQQMPMQQQQQMQMPQGYAMAPPQQQMQQQQPMGVSASAISAAAHGSSQYDMNPMMVTQQQQQLQMENPPLGAAEGMIVQPQALQEAQFPPPPPLQQQMVSPPVAQQAEPVPGQAMQAAMPLSEQPLGKSQPQGSGTTILYYDPRQTQTGPNGQIQLPAVVYDAQGNPIDLANLAARSQAQILLEAPMMQASNARGLAEQEGLPLQQQQASHPRGLVGEEALPLQQQPDISPERTLVEIPEAELSAPDIKKWGESTTQDQNIIVSTVAVMALLVGALSARRLRSRSVLSACIENESLEDDVAYDAAYTLGGHGSAYNTFGRAGWKGDLEKFDV